MYMAFVSLSNCSLGVYFQQSCHMRVYLQHIHGICLSVKLLIGSVFAAQVRQGRIEYFYAEVFTSATLTCVCCHSILILHLSKNFNSSSPFVIPPSPLSSPTPLSPSATIAQWRVQTNIVAAETTVFLDNLIYHCSKNASMPKFLP